MVVVCAPVCRQRCRGCGYRPRVLWVASGVLLPAPATPPRRRGAYNKDAAMADFDFSEGGTELLTVTRGERCPDHSAVLVLAAAGELDDSSAGVLWDSLAEELGPGRSVVLDLSAVTFFASVGVHLLMRAHIRSRSSGGILAVVASPVVRRILDLLGLLGQLPLYPTCHDALCHCADAGMSRCP